MDNQEIQRLREEEQTYWWHIARRMILESILNRFLPAIRHPEFISGSPSLTSKNIGLEMLKQVQHDGRRILDVGCGTGENFQWLGKFGKVAGVDTSELAVELASQKGTAVLGRAEDLPFEDQVFDLVAAFDVLEHLSEEERALGEWGRVLCSRGLLFISVPACQWLFGPHDRALGHYRRYSLPELIKLLKQYGFQPIFASYIFCGTFPLFFIQRWLARYSHQDAQQYIPVPQWVNNILIGLGKAEAGWLRVAKFPFGSSIVVLARKDNGNPSTSSGNNICRAELRHYHHSYSLSKFPFWKRIEGLHYFKISYQVIKFAIVGLGNTAIDFGVLNLLVQVLHWAVLPANVVSFSLAVTNSYFFTKYWTFQDKRAKSLQQFGLFMAVNLLGLGISTLIIKYGLPASETYWAGLAFGWRYNIVKVVSVFVVWTWNFLTYKFIIFGQRKPSII